MQEELQKKEEMLHQAGAAEAAVQKQAMMAIDEVSVKEEKERLAREARENAEREAAEAEAAKARALAMQRSQESREIRKRREDAERGTALCASHIYAPKVEFKYSAREVRLVYVLSLRND